MLRPRITPCLLIRDRGLVKTVRFAEPKYVGDPVNAVKIFNEKEAGTKEYAGFSGKPIGATGTMFIEMEHIESLHERLKTLAHGMDSSTKDRRTDHQACVPIGTGGARPW